MSEDLRLPMCPENLHEGMCLGPIHYVVTPERARAFLEAVKATKLDFMVDERIPTSVLLNESGEMQ